VNNAGGDSGQPLDFNHAYYIKLGAGGAWEEESIGNGLLRIGWRGYPLSEMLERDWPAMTARSLKESTTKGVSTRDMNALRDILDCPPGSVWITFHKSRLWWCRLLDTPIEKDGISKFRRVDGAWGDRDLRGQVLLVNELPGKLTRTQGFRGTACRVADVPLLRRILNGEPSSEANSIAKARADLAAAVEAGLGQLHWKDFEVLVDLLFRQSGWQRQTAVGETMKFTDIDLRDPITGDRYQVQVKSTADNAGLAAYAAAFDSAVFRKLFFVVHSPQGKLSLTPARENIEVIGPSRLAEMVIDLGLVPWLQAKLR
jgi:hypothetical protein